MPLYWEFPTVSVLYCCSFTFQIYSEMVPPRKTKKRVVDFDLLEAATKAANTDEPVFSKGKWNCSDCGERFNSQLWARRHQQAHYKIGLKKLRRFGLLSKCGRKLGNVALSCLGTKKYVKVEELKEGLQQVLSNRTIENVCNRHVFAVSHLLLLRGTKMRPFNRTRKIGESNTGVTSRTICSVEGNRSLHYPINKLSELSSDRRPVMELCSTYCKSKKLCFIRPN